MAAAGLANQAGHASPGGRAEHAKRTDIVAERPDESLLSDAAYADAGSRFSLQNRLGRALWMLVWMLLFRPTPRPLYGWRNLLLRSFGASIGRHVHVSPSVRIWAPWNLSMQDHASMGDAVDCYCVAPIRFGRHATVSQYTFLCTASHDFRVAGLPGFDAPIELGSHSWVCADVFVGPGVTVGEGAVIGARSVVLRDVAPWLVAAGNPATPRAERVLQPRTTKTPG